MLSIFHSDVYRVSRGAALRNTLIALLITLLFLGLSFRSLTSDGFVFMLDSAGEQVSEEEREAFREEMAELVEQAGIPTNAAEFATEMIASNILPFFLLPLLLAVFCADFSAGTYRNTLSYESNRTKVYLAKLGLTACCCAAINLATLLMSWLVGGILFGFGGFTAAYLARTLISLLLFFPTHMALAAFGHCLVAFTRKSSSTIAIYLGVLIVLSMVLQALSLFPALRWLAVLDWNSVGGLFARYWDAEPLSLVSAVAAGAVVTVGATALGLSRFKASDMN